MNDKELVEEANKQLPECDYVVDLYDSKFKWASSEALALTGYTKEDIDKIKNIDIVDEGMSDEEQKQRLISRMVTGEGVDESTLRHKLNGSLLHINFKYKVFKFKDRWYITGRILNVMGTSNGHSSPT